MIEIFHHFSSLQGEDYGSVKDGIKFIFVLWCLCCVLIGGGRVLSQNCRFEWAKLTAFECGFDPLSSTCYPFSMRFYLLALLFLVFDLEVVLLIPYVLSANIVIFPIPFINKLLCCVFLFILLVGLLHEYNEGSLEWIND